MLFQILKILLTPPKQGKKPTKAEKNTTWAIVAFLMLWWT